MSKISEIITALQSPPLSLSQGQIAELTGIPQPRISRWRAGGGPAGINDALRLMKLARKMGVATTTKKAS